MANSEEGAEGAESSGPLYATATAISTDSESTTYVRVFSEFEEELDLKPAREFSGWADLGTSGKYLFVSSGEGPTVERLLASYAEGDDPFDWLFGNVWELSTIDPETLETAPVSGLPTNGGGYYMSRFNNLSHLLIPGDGYTTTTISSVDDSGVATNLMHTEGWADNPVYTVGRRFGLDELVTAEASVVDTSRRLSVTQLTASDGSREPTSLYDTELESECRPRLMTDGQMHCVPPTNGVVYTRAPLAWYADPECQQLWGAWGQGTEPPSSGYLEADQAFNSRDPEPIYRILGEATERYFLDDGQCRKSSPEKGAFVLELVEPESLVTLDDVATKYGRLTVHLLVDQQGASAVRPQAWDNARDRACTFLLAADGTSRCFPASMPAAYEGGDCNTSSPLGQTDYLSFDETPNEDFVREWQGELCAGGLMLRERRERIDAPDHTSERSQAGGCFSTSHGFNCGYPDWHAYIGVGDLIDLNQFVAATVETE